MSRRRAYTPQTLGVLERFFAALDACVGVGLIKNPTRFCEDNGIDRRHYYAQRIDRNRGFFEASWMLPLLRCGVSADWLLTGRGRMFKER